MAAQTREIGRGGRCWPTPEQELLLTAALLEGPAGLAAWQAVSGKLDIERLDPASGGVLPLLFRRLRAHRIDHPLLGALKGFHRRSRARNERLLDAAWPVVRRLGEEGIEVALLKGAALLAVGDGDLGLRFMADVDLLVPTADRRRAIELVVACGFAPAGGLSTDAIDLLMPPTTPGYGFRNGDGLAIDLHWHALHHSRQPDADTAFWAASRQVTFRGRRVRVLDPADRLLHALVHGLRWSRLPPVRWVLDAVLICGGENRPDLSRLVEQARRRRLAVPVRRGLDYLRRRFQVSVPEATLRALDRSASLLQRWEADLEEGAPLARSALQGAAYRHLAEIRRRTPLNGRVGWRTHLAALVACRGLDRARQLPADLLLGQPWPHCVAAAAPATELAEGERLEVTRERFHHIVGRGWQVPEVHGTWAAGRVATIRLRPTGRSGQPVALTLSASAFVPDRAVSQRLDLWVNGRRLARWRLSHGRSELPRVRLALPAALAAAPALEIRFRTGPLRSPRDAGLGPDARRLGLLLNAVGLAPVPVLQRGERLRLGRAEAHLGEGWLEAGWRGARIEGSARLLLRLGAGPAGPAWLTATLMAEPGFGGAVEVLVNGRRRATWRWPEGTAGLLRRSARLAVRGHGRDQILSVAFRAAPSGPGAVWLRDLTLEDGPPREPDAMPVVAAPGAGGRWQEAAGAGLADLLDEGWSSPEDWGVWGVGPRHTLWVRPAGRPGDDLLLEADVQAVLLPARPRQAVDLLLDGAVLGRWDFTMEGNRGVRTLRLPAGSIAPGHRFCGLRVEFRPASVAAPHELDPGNPDDRPLGLGLFRLRQKVEAGP